MMIPASLTPIREHIPLHEQVLTAGGPNNQYMQLIETALIARALGRALVLAPFQPWTLDRGAPFVKVRASRIGMAHEVLSVVVERVEQEVLECGACVWRFRFHFAPTDGKG